MVHVFPLDKIHCALLMIIRKIVLIAFILKSSFWIIIKFVSREICIAMGSAFKLANAPYAILDGSLFKANVLINYK